MKSDKTVVQARTAAIRTQIDENLRKAYQNVLDEEIPDRFKDLLSALKTMDATPSTPSGADTTDVNPRDVVPEREKL